MEPQVNPGHIDCNAQLFRAHRTLADAIKRAEAAEAEVERLRTNQTAVFGHATIDKLREMYGPGRSRNATIEMLLTKIEELAARPAAAPDSGWQEVCGYLLHGGCGPVPRTAAEARAMIAENERNYRPAAASVAVPPVPEVTYSRVGKYGGVWIAGSTRVWTVESESVGPHDDGATLTKALGDWFAAHWPRAVSSEVEDTPQPVRDRLAEAMKSWEDQLTVARAQGAAEAYETGAEMAEDVALLAEKRGCRASWVETIAALARQLRARAAAAGAEGQTSGKGVAAHPAEAHIRESGIGNDAVVTSIDHQSRQPGETGTSPPPCAACGGDGTSFEFGTGTPELHTARFVDVPCPGCNGTGHARPPTSSAKAGEDDVEVKVSETTAGDFVMTVPRGDDDGTRWCVIMPRKWLAEETANAIRTFVRSERRRARAEALEKAAKECERYADSRPSSDPKLDGALSCADRIRALGGEEGS